MCLHGPNVLLRSRFNLDEGEEAEDLQLVDSPRALLVRLGLAAEKALVGRVHSEEAL